MRITNKIIQNNAITNINANKVLEDKYNNQLATGSKINRPSDDPVVAIRALRLRTNLSEVQQYYTKNVPDARSWLKITESAIASVIGVIEDMYSDCTTGSVGFKTAEDRQKILENMKGLRDEIYAVGNAESAGRYVFTGYRTDVSLAFQSKTQQKYSITEQIGIDRIEDRTYVDTAGLEDVTSANAGDFDALESTEFDVTNNSYHRIRLSYKDCSGTAPTIRYYDSNATVFYDQAGNELSADEVTYDADTDSYSDSSGNPVTVATEGRWKEITATIGSAYGDPDSTYLADQDGESAIFIPETGELILSDDLYNKLKSVKDVPGTVDADGNEVNEGEIRITYEKEDWNKNDLRPEHFFYCEKYGEDAKTKQVYNPGYLTNQLDDDTRQIIAYDVGFGQEMRVNTLASEVFSHAIGRDLEEMIADVEAVIQMEGIASQLESMIAKETDEGEKAKLEERLKAVNKSLTYLNDKMQKTFESGISKTQGYLNKANSANTTVGNRGSRLDLIENRLSSQESDFKTLAEENEGADVTEVAVQLQSIELTYNAALMATGKITQTSLLNYL